MMPAVICWALASGRGTNLSRVPPGNSQSWGSGMFSTWATIEFMNASSGEQHPGVRVFVPTCRREHLLRRALTSLRAQTFQNWVCEVHNDDPGDDAPGSIVAALAAPRITLSQHQRNLGGTESFN